MRMKIGNLHLNEGVSRATAGLFLLVKRRYMITLLKGAAAVSAAVAGKNSLIAHCADSQQGCSSRMGLPTGFSKYSHLRLLK